MERNLAYITLFTALIAALGLIPKIDLVSGVPITAQTLGVMLCGTVLGARRGALAALLFVFLVALGLPLLAGGRGGLGVLASPTVGYFISFPFAALATGLVFEHWQGRSLALGAGLASVFGGILLVHVCGIAGMSLILQISAPEAAVFALPFLPGDLIKAVVAGLVTASLAKARPDALLWRS